MYQNCSFLLCHSRRYVQLISSNRNCFARRRYLSSEPSTTKTVTDNEAKGSRLPAIGGVVLFGGAAFLISATAVFWNFGYDVLQRKWKLEAWKSNTKENIENEWEDLRDAVKESRQDLRDAVKDSRQDLKKVVRQSREELNEVKEDLLEVKEDLLDVKEDLQEVKESLVARIKQKLLAVGRRLRVIKSIESDAESDR